MDKVIIRDLTARCIIGIDDWERQEPQEIIINLILYTNTHRAGLSDDILDCVNYATVAQTIRKFVEVSQRHTVEALAEDIAGICLKENGVVMVRVKVEKPGAVGFCQTTGVEIRRRQSAM